MPSTLWSGKPRAPFPWFKQTRNQEIEEELLARFRTEAERQFNMREAYQKNIYIRDKYFRLARKKKLYDEYRRKVFGKRVKEEYAKALHAALRTSWHQMEAIEGLKDMAAVEKVATKESLANREEWIRTQQELDNFDLKREQELQTVEAALMPKGKGKGAKGIGKPPKGPLPKGPAQPVRKLAAQKGAKMPDQKQADLIEMPDLVLMTQKVGEYVEAVKAKKEKEIVEKFERQQLERKEGLEKQAADELLRKEMEDLKSRARSWERLNGQEAIKLQEEQRIVREEEERQFENRRILSLALVEARRLEWEEALARDHEMFTMMREDYSDEVFQEWMKWEEEKERRAEQKRLNRLRTCTEIILQIVTLMEIKNDYKDEFNSEMPSSTWRGWKTLFIKGCILPCPIWSDDLPPEHPRSDPNEIFAKEYMIQYLEEQGEWESVYVIGKNKELGCILWEILGVADSRPPPASEPINLTKFKLKMAVVGAPYTGKTTVAKKLELDFDIVKIDLQNVMSSALALAEVEEQEHKIQVAEEDAKKAELEARLIEEEKQKIRDDLNQEASGKKEILLRENRMPEEPPPEAPPAKGPKGEKKSKDEKSPKREKGQEKEKEKVKEKEEKQPKGKGKQKMEQEKGIDISSDKTSKEEVEKVGLKPMETAMGNTEQPKLVSETVPAPVPDPVVDLSYLTPKARFGMDIKLAREKGVQPPAQALAGLVVLTMANLKEYADAFVQLAKPTKGAKGAPEKAKKEVAKKVPPLKGGKGGPKGTVTKGAPAKKGTAVEPEEKLWGFVLDGFPSNAEEAKALELQLTGMDPDYMANHLAKASKIAPPPQLDKTELSTSVLDGILQLEAIEEKEALKRAMGKVLDPKTGKIYHLEYDPPPTKEKGLAQRVKPIEVLEDVRTKIIAGTESWGRLSEYLAQISNLFSVAQVEEDNKKIIDTEEPCNLAQRFLDGWSKTQAAKAAAQAALQAESATIQALGDAEKANQVASEVAGQYWNAKLAEVETEKGLDALGGNPLAKKLVKEKVTVTLAKKFDETCKAVQEAEEAADSARAFAMQAEQMAHEAQDKVSEADLEFAHHVKGEAEGAAECAKEAAIRAESSLQKAIAAYESAKAALNPPPEEEKAPPGKKDKESAKKEKEAGSKEKEGSKKQKEATGKTDPKGAKKEIGKASAKGGSNEAKDDSSSPIIPSQELVSPPEPIIPPILEKDLAVELHVEWEKIEAKYFRDLESVFYTLHQERARTRDVVVETVSNFVAHLQDRDERQAVFNDFQEKYNRVEMADRRDKKVKPKLEQEVVKLDKTLNGLMEIRTKKCWELSEQSLISLLQSRVASLVELFTTLVQTECMIATLIENDQKDDVTLPVHREWILQYRGGDQARKAALTGNPDTVFINLREISNEPVASFPVPGWLIALSSPLPKLHKVIMTAMSAAYDVLGTIFGQGPDASEKSKKKGDKREKEDSDKKKKGDKSDKKSEKSAKKDKGKKSEKQTDDADVLQEKPKEIVETPPPPIDEGIPPAAGREHQVLLQRLQRIAKVAINYFLDLQPIVDGAYRRMDEWGKSRLNAEAEVVKEVVDLAKEAVDENIPLWYKVYLDGDQFRIDESQLQLECSVSDLTNLDLWHCKVMETLLTDFRKLCQGGAPDDSPGAAIASLLTPLPYAAKVILYIAIPTLILTPGEEEPPAEGKSKGKGSKKQEKEKKESKKGSQVIDPSSTTPAEPLSNFVRVGAAKAATDQVLQTVHTSFKDDLKESLLPRLPASKKNPRGPFQDWQNISNFMFQELLDDENKASKFIDWRAFLIALVDAHYLHIISNATREDLISTRKAFIEFATTDKPPEAAGFLTLEEFLRIPLWFDSTSPIPEGEFDLGISVKIFVFNVLDDGGKGVPWVKLLLYLCRDSDPYHALQKAFCVISGTISDDTHLTPEEVLLILYPGGVDASWKAEIVPFIMEDIQNYLYYVAREKFIRAEKAEESDFGGSEESGSHDLSVERASTESTRSEQETVDDFLNFSYGEFPELIQAETVNDFLESLATVAPLDETVKEVPREKPFICDIHDIPTRPARELSDPDEFAIPTTYTVDDIVRTEAMKRLRDMLYCNYSSDTLQLFDKTPIEDDPVEETGDGKLENKKNKDEGGEEGESSDEKTKKKKKKDKKEKKDKKKKKEK